MLVLEPLHSRVAVQPLDTRMIAMEDMSNHPQQSADAVSVDMAGARAASTERLRIGEVMDIAGSSSQILIQSELIKQLIDSTDSAVSMAGQVGSQIKIRVGNTWLLAGIRNQRMHPRDPSIIIAVADNHYANITFLLNQVFTHFHHRAAAFAMLNSAAK